MLIYFTRPRTPYGYLVGVGKQQPTSQIQRAQLENMEIIMSNCILDF